MAAPHGLQHDDYLLAQGPLATWGKNHPIFSIRDGRLGHRQR